VKDECVKPELEVRAQLFEVLVRSFDTASGDAHVSTPSPPFHLARVVHAGLCLGRRASAAQIFVSSSARDRSVS